MFKKRIADHFPDSGLVKQYEPFIKKWCANFGAMYPHLEMADILSDAVVIAYKAEKAFKPELGHDFSTYLRHRLREMHRSAAKQTGGQRQEVMSAERYRRELALDNPPAPVLRLPGGKGPRLLFDLQWTLLKGLYGGFIRFFDHPNWSSDRGQDIPEFRKLGKTKTPFPVSSTDAEQLPTASRHRVVAGTRLRPGDNAEATHERIGTELPKLHLRPSPILAGWIRAVFDHLVRRQREADQEARNADHAPVFLEAEPNARVKFAQPRRPFRILRRFVDVLSLDQRVGKSQHDDGALSAGITLGDVIPDHAPNPEQALIAAEQREILTEAVQATITDPTERKIADRMLCALDNARSRGWKAEIARELDITRGAVSKIEGRITGKVQRWIENRR